MAFFFDKDKPAFDGRGVGDELFTLHMAIGQHGGRKKQAYY